MNLVTKDDLVNWAKTYPAKSDFPMLIWRLVQVTAPISTKFNFPSGASVYIGGWDGIVNSLENRGNVPDGISYWELGTEKDVKGKADGDYDKRTASTPDSEKANATFIFATPRYWSNKEDWQKEKNDEKKWKEVRVYDAEDLEQWLIKAPAIARWFSALIGKYPSDGIQTTERFWKEWSTGPKGILPPLVVAAGRDKESRVLFDFLNGKPNFMGVQASSKEEAIAFIIASVQQFEKEHKERFFSKSLIVSHPDHFRSITVNASPLNLIARFDDSSPIYVAVSEGHHVLIALGADDSFSPDPMVLSPIDRDGQVKALVESGISEDDSTRFSKEAGRNISIVKKFLDFPQINNAWINRADIRDFIPALLVGRWDENKRGDRELLERLSGEPYSDYIATITKWKSIEESPIMQIGNLWRLTSPLDAWISATPIIIKADLDKLAQCFSTCFENGNPLLQLETGGPLAGLFQETKYSSWSREGLIQSMILVALYGTRLKINLGQDAQSWVDECVRKLLDGAKADIWISLNYEMPLLAEASPASFLSAVNQSLDSQDKEIMQMFIETDGFLSSQANHTGLLWALESLAWLPEYFLDAVLTLTKLSILDPGGKLTNRPANSLSEIFKVWHVQTLANLEERLEALEEMSKLSASVTWNLILKLLPISGGVAFPTRKTRWRIFEEHRQQNRHTSDIPKSYEGMLNILLSIFDYSDQQLSQLIQESTGIFQNGRKRILEFAKENFLKINFEEDITWSKLRHILSHHKSHPTADWALSAEALVPYEEIYTLLTPADNIRKTIWLFDELSPALPEGILDDGVRMKSDEVQKLHTDKRISAITDYYKVYGVQKIKELIPVVKYSYQLGDISAYVINNETDVETILELISGTEHELNFLYAFLYRKIILNSIDWIKPHYQRLLAIGLNSEIIARLFIPLPQSKELWDYLDTLESNISDEYWRSVNPFFFHLSDSEKNYGIEKLIHYKRLSSALYITHFSPNIFPTQTLINILERLMEDNIDKQQIDQYGIIQLFEELDKREDVEINTLVRLEMLHLPTLANYGGQRNPRLLNKELATNPSFFVDMLKMLYLPSDKERLEEERKGLNDTQIYNMGKRAFDLLHNWKEIPGLQEDRAIDSDFLRSWVAEARKLAAEADRLEVADMEIAKVFAQYPEKDSEWPPEIISTIIEEIDTDSIKRNFSAAIFNKRGVTVRGPFDGGTIERNEATHFDKLAKFNKRRHPKVAKILSDLALSYSSRAEQLDAEAQRDKLEY
ncbi:MAG: hypothetical protein JST90_15995 [Bacteroidetes bacterium]|nr:hypothetical protein [Bacteroidota bacterium]